MKIIPSRTEPEHFDLLGVSHIELENLLKGIKGERHYLANTPWGKGTTEQIEKALAESRKFYLETHW